MATYKITIRLDNGEARILEVTGAKERVQKLASVLSTIASEKRMFQEARVLTGTLGNHDPNDWEREKEHITICLFAGDEGAGGQWPDYDGYIKARDTFLDRAHLPAKIGAKDIDRIYREAKALELKFMPVKDERRTPDERKAQVAESNRIAAEQEAKWQEAKRQEQESNARLHAANPHLVPANNSGKLYGCTLAAENIRRELAREFPGVVFSVKSERFAGGDAVRISWTDGPTTKQVDAICERYQPYTSDQTGDFWDFQEDLAEWSNAFGSAKFVQTSRHDSPETMAVLLAWAEAHPISNAQNEWYWEPRYRANRLFEATSFPAGARVLGVERRPDDDEDDKQTDEARYWQVIFSAPTTTPATWDAPATASSNGSSNTASDGTAYTVEHERDWTWISFASKPAPAVLDAVRGLGARWGKRRGAWYLTRPIDSAVIVNALAGREVFDVGARAMEQAAGIAAY